MNSKLPNWLAAAAVAALVCTSVSAEPISAEERDQIERELEQTRAEIQRLSERLADLSLGLAEEEIARARIIERRVLKEHGGSDRAMLGIVLTDTGAAGDGPTVSAVTPDGPADKAGLRTGDRIVALDGARIAARDGSSGVLDFMQRVEPGETVAVTVERDGREEVLDVVTSDDSFSFAFSFNDQDFEFDGKGLGETIEHAVEFAMNGLQGALFGVVFPDVEVVALTPGLGDYFGVNKGLLVVSAPRDGALDLRDGDVLVEIDGEPVSEPSDLFEILNRRDGGDTVALKVVRQRQTLSINAPLPDGKSQRVFIHRDDKD